MEGGGYRGLQGQTLYVEVGRYLGFKVKPRKEKLVVNLGNWLICVKACRVRPEKAGGTKCEVWLMRSVTYIKYGIH